MSATPRLNLPYIAPLQAQKQVTYNEAMAALDQLVQPVVKSRSLAAPPVGPVDGDSYIVPPLATGDWAGKDGQLATWLDGGWRYQVPGDGWLMFVRDSGNFALRQGSGWTALAPLPHYEEGTWTPELQFGGAAVGLSYASPPAGRFTRIGRTVFATGTLALSAKGSSTGPATIAGLPQPSADDGVPQAAAIAQTSGFSAVSGALHAALPANTDRLSLFQLSSGTSNTLTQLHFGNSAQLTFSVVYDV
ncbi:MAG TPA: DUF2793 domain-containing protein [Devosia sp.]|jgi:hypothetical protein|nr:DUF2793 domain-containing protein [Devosia sp.]